MAPIAAGNISSFVLAASPATRAASKDRPHPPEDSASSTAHQQPTVPSSAATE